MTEVHAVEHGFFAVENSEVLIPCGMFEVLNPIEMG